MTYTITAAASVFIVGALLSTPVRADPPTDIQIVDGACDPASHTAEGPIGADLTKRRSKFYCDSAVITFFDNYNSHILIQFSQKESHHSQILGFGGIVDSEGVTMQVDHVYFSPGHATTVSDGWCKFFFKGRHMSEIFCGIKVDERLIPLAPVPQNVVTGVWGWL